MNKVFFNHIDRSESLESFIDDKTSHLHSDESFNWIISKESNKDFKVKCIGKTKVFSEVGKDPYHLVNSIIGKMKSKEKYKKSA